MFEVLVLKCEDKPASKPSSKQVLNAFDISLHQQIEGIVVSDVNYFIKLSTVDKKNAP